MLATLIIILPLIGALIPQLICNNNFIVVASSMLMSVATLVSWYLFLGDELSGTIAIIPWLSVGSFHFNWAIAFDRLTALMFVVVTTVSTVVHVYSIGYMHGDNKIKQFFSYISLFTFFMLVLVSSDNFIQLFFGWEGVGVCSYLLIGFWFKKDSANNAAMKAFVVNRVGDFALAIGIALIYYLFDSVNFADVFSHAAIYKDHTTYGVNTLTIITLLLFVGCMGKSAQIGLHTWLPDAMEGPTPVSALIHAATMVTAGVFLLARCSVLFELTSFTREFIIIVGGLTCFFAGTIASVQNDIKKIIAYSTCSQLGYMFMACGLSAYNLAMFHLATHAFFKALLFLCAGNVIHSMSGQQDINKMSTDLYRKIPITYVLMWVGSLAIAGIFPFAGFYSKDLILEAAHASAFAWSSGMFVVVLTAFYSWRLLIKVFHSKGGNVQSDPHESPSVMLVPLCVLSLFSIFAGVLGEYLFHVTNESFWQGATTVVAVPHVNFIDKNLPIVFAILGIVMAYITNKSRLSQGKFVAMTLFSFGFLIGVFLYHGSIVYIAIYSLLLFLVIFTWNAVWKKLLINKYYFDEIYNIVFVKGIKCFSKSVWRYIDVQLIDNAGIRGIITLVQRAANRVTVLQTGFVFDYTLSMLVGVVLIVAVFMYLF